MTHPLPIHPISNIWHDMSSEDWDGLRASILSQGLLQPIVTWQGAVVDGRHRQRACAETGTPPRYDALPDDWDQERVLMHCAGLHRRRNSTPGQLAAAAVNAEDLLEQYRAEARGRKAEAIAESNTRRANPMSARGRSLDETPGTTPPRPVSKPRANKAAAAIAKTVGSSERSVERAAFVKRAAPTVFARVESGEVSLKVAERIAKAPQERHAAMLDQLDTGSRTEGASDTWGTPTEWIELARKVMGGIDLDPASNPAAQEIVRAAKFFTKDDDGLAQEWAGRIWLNPPYSQPLVTLFAEKLIAAIGAGRVQQALVLVNNATDTVFGQMLLADCSAVLFPKGRISFVLPGTSVELSGGKQGQMLVYFGDNVEHFTALGQQLGWVGVTP